MTPATLQALRRLLFFSVDEAAAMIGGVSPRSWQFWERGDRTIPDDVIATLRRLCAWRQKAIAAGSVQMAKAPVGTELVLIWYGSLDDWTSMSDREPELWRPHCSVAAELAARHSAILVTFDGPAYAAWIGQRVDSETLRGAWAAGHVAD